MTENGSPHSDARIQRTRQKLRLFLAKECRVADVSIVPTQSDGTVRLLVLDFVRGIILAEFRIYNRFPPAEGPEYIPRQAHVTHARTYAVTPADTPDGFQVLKLADKGTVLIPNLEVEARGWDRLFHEVFHTPNVPQAGINVEDQKPLILLNSLSLKSWVWIASILVSALFVAFKTGKGRGAQIAKASVDSTTQALQQSRDSIGKLIRKLPPAQIPVAPHAGKEQGLGRSTSVAPAARSMNRRDAR